MCTRRLTRELRAIEKNPLTNPKVYTTPLESNILEWHYVIEGHENSPYEGGFYWGKLVFPKEYPLKPPSVIMLTPNGRFTTGRRLCLSMSDFHPESWNPMWSVSTIITGLISFMVESSPTLGSIDTTVHKKKQLAKQSLDFNVKDATFAKLFPNLVTLHQEIQQKRKELGITDDTRNNYNGDVTNSIGGPGVGEGNLNQMQAVMAVFAGFVAILSILCAMRFF